MNVRFARLYGWCKQATPTTEVSPRKAVTVSELEAEVRSLRKELRETKRANEILKAAASFFGVETCRQSQRWLSLFRLIAKSSGSIPSVR